MNAPHMIPQLVSSQKPLFANIQTSRNATRVLYHSGIMLARMTPHI